MVLCSDYRALYKPLAAYAKKLASEHPERQVAVIVPELVGHLWYRAPFPFDVATILHAELLEYGGPPVVVVSAPRSVRDRTDGRG